MEIESRKHEKLILSHLPTNSNSKKVKKVKVSSISLLFILFHSPHITHTSYHSHLIFSRISFLCLVQQKHFYVIETFSVLDNGLLDLNLLFCKNWRECFHLEIKKWYTRKSFSLGNHFHFPTLEVSIELTSFSNILYI